MMKIWTVWDNYNAEAIGAYRSEKSAEQAKTAFLVGQNDEFFDEQDILIEPFDLED